MSTQNTTGSTNHEPSNSAKHPKTVHSAEASLHPDRAALATILRLAKNRPIPFLIGQTFWIIVGLLPLIPAWLSQQYIDSLEGVEGAPTLTYIIVAMLAYSLGSLTLIASALYQFSVVVFRAIATVMQNLFKALLSRPGAVSPSLSTGEIMSRFRDDIDAIMLGIDFSVELGGTIVTALIGFFIAANINLTMALVAYIPMVVAMFAIRTLIRRIEIARKQSRDATEVVTSLMAESFGAVQAIKAAGAEANMVAALTKPNEHRRNMMVKDRVLDTFMKTASGYMVDIATGIILVVSATTLATENGLSLGEFTFFTYLLGFMGQAADMSATAMARLRQAGVSVARIGEVLQDVSNIAGRGQVAVAKELTKARPWSDLETADATNRPGSTSASALTTAPPPTAGTATGGGAAGGTAGVPLLQVESLSASFAASDGDGDKRKAALHDISFDVDAGEFVVITGKVGSAKSTLLRALLGLVPNDGGSLFWRGVEVEDLDSEMAPPRCAYTPQVPTLFSMSLENNLRLGLAASDDEINAAIDDAAFSPDLADMPEGLETQVGTRGLRLSGGQVQRCATARMLLRRPELLVIDDVSSALDVTTEEQLWNRLCDVDNPNRPAVLAVSHRRPALARADKIIVLDEGRIVATGTANELRTSNQLFTELWG